MDERPMNDPPLPHLTGGRTNTSTTVTVTVTTRVKTKVVIARPLVLLLISLALLFAVFISRAIGFTPLLNLPRQGDVLVRSVVAIGVLLFFWSIYDCARWIRNAKRTSVE
jgi:hypothetical protein